MKYAESKTLLAVRQIKEHLHEKREQEGAEAFFARINLRAGKLGSTAKPKTNRKSRPNTHLDFLG